MAKIIKTDGTEEILNDLSLESMQKAVGGYIEVVSFPQSKFLFVCDEEGKLKGYPFNAKATELAHSAMALSPDDVLVGDVIVAQKGELK